MAENLIHARGGGCRLSALFFGLLCALTLTSQAALQFDVFLGYDGIVPEASWFPVVCEINNDGPGFTATIEIEGGNYTQGQTRRLVLELPTNSPKRVVIPVFSANRNYSSWDVRLLDERGKVRSEQLGVRPRKQVAQGTPLLGALSRTAGGTPMIRAILPQNSELQPTSARFLPVLFPDNPLVLEGLSCLYLNSERAADLRGSQVSALLAWLNAGGHLIVAVEQPSDISASTWLKSIFPCELTDLRTVTRHSELGDWLRNTSWTSNPVAAARSTRRQSGRPFTSVPEQTVSNPFRDLPTDPAFEAAALQVAVGQLRDGTAQVTAEDTPLIVTAARGRGRITALLFSPEREPMRSWKQLPTFWAKVAEVPGEWYLSKDFNQMGGWSSDGIFGAMIDSRQVHKLPVGWLLLLLVGYLAVIGPLDQYWLKRINKPMLTWITFPCYVVAFSLLIYFIGYKLRAGEAEWNDLHIVDVLTRGEGAELRGRTYSSVYSPVNQRYGLESQQKYAAFRGEFAGVWGGSQTGEKASILQEGDKFKAEISVPLWLPQLYVSDWWQSAPLPFRAAVRANGNGWQVRLENRNDRKLTNLQIVLDDRIVPIGELAANEIRTVTVSRGEGRLLQEYVRTHGNSFQNAVSSRQRAFGQSSEAQLMDAPNSAMAASFLSQLSQGQQPGYMNNNFIAPPGLDLTAIAKQGNAIVLAWAADYAPVKPFYQFQPRRSHRDTLWRVAVAVE